MPYRQVISHIQFTIYSIVYSVTCGLFGCLFIVICLYGVEGEKLMPNKPCRFINRIYFEESKHFEESKQAFQDE